MTMFSDLVARGVLAIGDGYRAKNEELGGEGPIFLRSAYLQDRGWILDIPDRFIGAPPSGFGAKLAQSGDTVLTTKGNSLGRLGFVNAAIEGSVYSPHLSYWRSLRHNELLPRYLYYWAHSSAAQDQIMARSQSTDMAPYLSLADQLALKIELPTIQVQQQAAGLLGALDDKIELNRQMVKTLDAMARASFKSWFIDFDPVRAKALRHGTSLSDDVAALFPEGFSEHGLPTGWFQQPVSALLENVITRVKPSPLIAAKPYVPIDAILPKSLCGVVGRSGYEAQSSLVSFEKDDILFGAMRPYFHKVCIAPYAGTTRTTVFVLRPKHLSDLVYSLLLMSEDSTIEFATNSASGSTIPYAVWAGSLANMPVTLPPPPVRTAFGNVVLPMLRRAQQALEQCHALAELRDTLLPRLISGDLRIIDAEKRIAAA
jgi:type I restriction enzyme S subunit